MKKIFALLSLSALALYAQVPPPDDATPVIRTRVDRDAAIRAAALRAQTNTTAATSTPPVPGASPAVSTPSGNAPATAPATDMVEIKPSAEALARAADLDQMLPAGSIDFVAAKLDQVLKIYAEMVAKTLLRPANLNSPDIVLKTQTPLTKREVIQALEAVLALNGIALVNVDDKFVKVVPQAQAGQEGAQFGEKDASELPRIGSYVTHIVQLKYVKPTEIMLALQPFAKIPNSILPIDASGILVLRDYTENVKRMLEMIKRIDVTVESEFISEVIPIKYALASDIASALNSLGGSGGGSTSVGGSAGRGTGGTRTGAAGANRLGGAGGYGGGQGGFGQPGFGTQQGGVGQPGGALGAPSGTSSFSDRLNRIINRAATGSSSGDLQLLGTTKIISDERMNALLIFASRADMNTITNIIAKLDVVLAQVLIETIIVDVSFGDKFSFGVSAVQKPKPATGATQGAGGMNANKFFDFTGGAATNAFGDLLGSGIKYFGKVNEDILISLEAMASDGRAKVIQKPRIQTSHATPASLFIGQTVPYVTGSYYGGYGGSPGSTYQQLRVGIGLDVTPFINPEGLVVMQIQESIDEISGSTKIEGVGNVPNTTSRTLSGEVAVRDRETIILGGFMRNFDQSTKSGVPYLKDIPLLGYLFRSTDTQKERSELIVLMRPTVLRTPELAALQVDVEKKRLPGVAGAERDLEKSETREAAAEDIRRFKESSSFTPEEKKLYGTPEPTKP